MINLGDEVKDTVSGFVGQAISRHKYLQGCDRIGVQPKVKKDGTLPEPKCFDEPQLVVTKAAKPKQESEESRRRGGPPPYMPGEKFRP